MDYTRQTGGKETVADIETADCKSFLSHLALQERVSSSTQNQAFNAILFLFRHVLCKDMGNMAETVRVKRDQKLPVVFSVDPRAGKVRRHHIGDSAIQEMIKKQSEKRAFPKTLPLILYVTALLCIY